MRRHGVGREDLHRRSLDVAGVSVAAPHGTRRLRSSDQDGPQPSR